MSSHKPIVNLVRLGRTKYLPTLKLQHYLVEKVKNSRAKVADEMEKMNVPKSHNMYTNYLLILEHDPVYTTGIRNRNEYSKEAEKTNFAKLGADFVQTDRGGLITFHGPGQLVVYPILNLETFIPENDSASAQSKKGNLVGIRWYVNTLEQSVIDLLKEIYGFSPHRSPHTGVWLSEENGINERKICAMGVHSSQLVTSHGLALNCSTDLNWFNHIVPCGIEGKGVTSITQELLNRGRKSATVEEVIPHYINSFKRNFQCDVKEHENSEFRDFIMNKS